ncbi:MAG TPA: phosphoribosyltransferase [Candidatus Binatia bacterium]|nr:phosphoribosyltransferase [Candidatus Binatia bacterium]
MMFDDRKDAGRRLATALMRFKGEQPIVLALPRGGVPVGYEVARALDAPLDVIVVRKLGAPGQPELGLGAVVDGDHPQTVLNEDVMEVLHVSDRYLQAEVATELDEIRRRQARYRGGRAPLPVKGRTVIVVDDGIATGGSMRAALRGVGRAQPRRVVLAVPVAPLDTIESLRAEVDEVVCLSTPAWFGAVGNFYRDFSQTTDEEVIELLDAARTGGEQGASPDRTEKLHPL